MTINQEHLTAESRKLWAQNLRVLQGFRMAPDDRGHIEMLLKLMAPEKCTSWVDIGCGFGEPARLMCELRPDLDFSLVNNNSYQLSQAPTGMPTHLCDMHELPFEDGAFDGAMFLYSLCNADNPVVALKEAARVVRPEVGRLFVFDYLRTQGDDRVSQRYLHASFPSYAALHAMLRVSGWAFVGLAMPEGDDSVFRSLCEDQQLYNHILGGVTPVVWWAVRR